MLVVVWDELYQAIPKIKAQEQLAAYTLAVVSSPYLNEEGERERDKILETWRNLLTRSRKWLKGGYRSSHDSDEDEDDDHRMFPSMRTLARKFSEILGSGMRD